MKAGTNREWGRETGTSFAVFCVCAEPDVLHATIAAAEQASQTFFAGEFRDYITIERRPQFSQSIKDARGCLALVDFDRDPELALGTVERLNQVFLSRISVVAVGAPLDAALLLRAVRAGCTDFLSSPVSAVDVVSAIQRFQHSNVVNPMAPSLGRVLAFFGAKGGVGTTTLAVHLANYLVTRHGKKTLLIDHKHQLGHVALYLGLKDTQYHFDELLKNVDRLDAELMNGYAIRHLSGLDVMASPEIATTYHESNGDEMERVMDFLRSEYDYILIDSSVEYQDTKTAIITVADEVYLVSTPDVASLRDLARLVEHIDLSPFAHGKLRLIVNRSTASDSLTAQQIEKAVRFSVSHTVPNNYGELLKAINQGVPVSSLEKSSFNQALAAITRQIVHGAEQGDTVGTEAVPGKDEKGKKFSFWRRAQR
jgi:pilus assembly protein CpaE